MCREVIRVEDGEGRGWLQVRAVVFVWIDVLEALRIGGSAAEGPMGVSQPWGRRTHSRFGFADFLVSLQRF